MTVPSNIPAKVSYIGNATTNTYDFPFRAEAISDIQVVIAEVATGEQEVFDGGVSARFTATWDFFPLLSGEVELQPFTLLPGGLDYLDGSGFLKAGYKIVILYKLDARQPTQFRDTSNMTPVNVEKGLDRLTMAIKAVINRTNQALRLQDSDEGDPQLPPTEGNENRGLYVNPTGDGFIYGPTASEISGEGLPPGGLAGAALTKVSGTDFDADWDDFVITGFSNRFGVAWSSAGLRDTLLKILDIIYASPLIASFTGSSNVLREKGTSVSNITLSVAVTKRTNLIARIRFLQGATVIQDDNPPAQTGSGTTTAPYVGPFTDNITFTVEVTDEATVDGGPTTVSANVSYSFVYPYYKGAGAVGLSAAAVAGLTKLVMNSNANYNTTFTTANGDVYYFAYPASYGNLVSILDENGFETFSSWTRRTENITGLDGNAVSYAIYEFNNPVVAGSTNFTFKR